MIYTPVFAKLFLFPLLLIPRQEVISPSQAVPTHTVPTNYPPKSEQLQKSISVDSKCLSLEAFFDRIHNETGVLLRADAIYRNQKLQLRLKNRSIEEVMASLSELFGGVWIAKDGEFLFQNNPDVARKRVSWWYAFDAERKKTLATVPQQFRNAMSSRKPDWTIIQGKSGKELIDSTSTLHLTQFWYDLPAYLQQAICDNVPDSYSYPRVEIAFPVVGEGGVVWTLSALPPSSAESLQYMLGLTNPAVSRSQIRNLFTRYSGRTILVDATIDGLGSDGKHVAQGSTGISLRYPDRDGFSLLGLDHTNLKESLEKRGQKLSAYQERLVDFQSQTFWRNDLSKSDKHAGPKSSYFTLKKVESKSGSSAGLSKNMLDSALPRLPDMLEKLAPKTEYIADYYSLPYRPLTPQEWDAKLKDTVEEDLNDLAKEYDYSWKKQSENLFLIRNNRWYRDDNLEVPVQVADELDALSRHAERVSFAEANSAGLYQVLEAASFAATRLSKWQIANGLYFYVREENVPQHKESTVAAQQNLNDYRESRCQPYVGIALTALLYTKTCRFYASLGYQDRIRLFTEGISINALSKAQQDLLIAASPGAAGLSESSVVRIKGKKNSLSITTPYIYGSKSNGIMPYTIDFEYTDATKE